MNENSAFLRNRLSLLLLILNILISTEYSSAQITTPLGDPAKYVYGLADDGQIFEIDIKNGATNKTIKNATYTGHTVSLPNGLGYNPIDGKFYYFTNNSAPPSQEFVSFNPATGIISSLPRNTSESKTVTGCVSNDGKGYYTLTAYGELHYYDIASNQWKLITKELEDNYGTDISSLVFEWGNGDIAFDGVGNLWIVVSRSDNYAVYKIASPPPISNVPKLIATRIIAPSESTTSTSHHNAIAGIALGADGSMFMSTVDDKLYNLQNNSTLTKVADIAVKTAGSDLTSRNFPVKIVLPVRWVSINAFLEKNKKVTLKWSVFEYENKGFYIQHSEDGLTWSDLYFIKSKNNSQSEQAYAYTFSYTASLSGRQYYRIHQIDLDGRESFSRIKVLNFDTNTSTIAVRPNPARNSLYIDNNSGTDAMITRVQFYDLSGKLAIDKELQQGVNVIDISSLATGSYIVTTTTGNGNLFTSKIVKQ